MNLRIAIFIILALFSSAVVLAESDKVYNRIHPVFPLLDVNGQALRETNEPLSTKTTCGNCHDTQFIEAHNDHGGEIESATCIQCHFEQGKLDFADDDFDPDGNLKRSAIRIHSPKPENCAACHGFVHAGPKPLSLPEDFLKSTPSGKPYRYDRTALTGEIISGQKRSDSYMNLANKDSLSNPWDVHAGRLVTCTACHYSRNNPEKIEVENDKLPFLKRDPRRLTMSQYLYQPDHRLEAANCMRCHDPLAAHDDLPYKERHMAKLECLSCHAPLVMGPAIRSIDETVVTAQGGAVVDYRNTAMGNAASINSAFIKGYQPALLEKEGAGESRLAPYNLITRFYWTQAGNEAVAIEKVAAAYLDEGEYRREVRRLFDSDKDGRLNDGELRLDTQAKIKLIESRLVALGVDLPRIEAKVTAHEIEHGTMTDDWVSFDCASCHSEQSRIGKDFPLAGYRIPGVVVEARAEEDEDERVILGSIEKDGGEGLRHVSDNSRSSHYLLGFSRSVWSDSLGFSLLLLTFIAIGIHGGLRIRSRNKNGTVHAATMRRVYMYSLYERSWHWLMAASIILLLLTGIEIHWVDSLPFFGFLNAVSLHNFLALVLIINAFLSLFYHLVSNDIKQFIPKRATFFEEVVAQAKYYLNGIFTGAPHPMRKTPERKLNPLQQVTYMMLLNVLFPFQVLSGIAIWAAGWFPESAEAIGGLSWVLPLHNLGAWLLASFIVAHVYLTTTGHGVFTNIKAMIVGYEEIEMDTKYRRIKEEA